MEDKEIRRVFDNDAPGVIFALIDKFGFFRLVVVLER